MPHEINIRKIPFDFTATNSPVWHPHKLEWSHMVNGASLTMPYLEPFLIKNLREAISEIEDDDLKQDVQGFIGQEAQHFTKHRAYNEFLKANGYDELSEVETTFTAGFEKLSKRSLAWRLAYTAGFETMTMGITEWMVNDRDFLFKGSDPTVASLVLWHMVEETEHKSVAFDVFQAVSGNYFLRALGLVYGSLHLAFLSRRAYIVMLKKDGLWNNLTSRLRLWHMVARFFAKASGAMLQSLLPGYHPDKVTDPQWVSDWCRAYRALDEIQPEDLVPLLRTDQETIVPSFSQT